MLENHRYPNKWSHYPCRIGGSEGWWQYQSYDGLLRCRDSRYFQKVGEIVHWQMEEKVQGHGNYEDILCECVGQRYTWGTMGGLGGQEPGIGCCGQ